MRLAVPPLGRLGIALVLAITCVSPVLAHDRDSRGHRDGNIDGPETILESVPFKLCAGKNDRGTYLWRGTSILGDSTRSCVNIAGLSPGTYTFTLRFDPKNGRRNWPSDVRTFTQEVTVITQAQVCDITAPDRVPPCTDVELCAPEFDGVHYAWSGPGLSRWHDDLRCVTARGLEPGTHTFTLDITGLGAPAHCERTVVVGDPQACLISGPTRVARDQSFELCGPDGAYTWLWQGKHITDGTATRCVTVPGLSPGHYEYTLQLTNGDAVEACTWSVTVVDSTANCFVSGPSDVFAHEAFELCGPEGDHTYSWHGNGIPSGTTSRCVTVAGVYPGSYKYELTLDGAETCSFAVKATDSLATTICPQPLAFWQQNCGRFTRNGFISNEDLTRIASCIDSRTAAVDWADDLAGFNDVLNGKAWRGSNRMLLQQYVVLLANVCAADMGMLNAQGDSIGLRLETSVSCGDNQTTIAELIASIDSLLTSTTKGRSVHTDDYRCLPAFACLSRINEGRGEEFACWTGRHTDRRNDGDDRDNRRFNHFDASAPSTEATLQLAQPSPNPFTSSTRVQYAVPAGGADVDLAIYDLSGRMIIRLASGHWEAGVHDVTWNGTDSNGITVRPAMYFLRGRLGQQQTAWRLMYVK